MKKADEGKDRESTRKVEPRPSSCPPPSSSSVAADEEKRPPPPSSSVTSLSSSPCMANFHPDPQRRCSDRKVCPYSHNCYVIHFARLCQRTAVSLESLPTSTSAFTPVLAHLPADPFATIPQRWVVSFPLPRIRSVLKRLLGHDGRLVRHIFESTGVRHHTLPDPHHFPEIHPGEPSVDWLCLNAQGTKHAIDSLMEALLSFLSGEWRKPSSDESGSDREELRLTLQNFKSQRASGLHKRLEWDEFFALTSRKAPLLPPLPATSPPSPPPSPPQPSAQRTPPPVKADPVAAVSAEEALLRSAPLDLYEWYEEGLQQPFSSAVFVPDFTSTPLRYIRALAEETFACLHIEARRDVRTTFSIEPLSDALFISAISRKFECEVFVPLMDAEGETNKGEDTALDGRGQWLQVTVWRNHPQGPAPDGRDRHLLEDAVRALLVRYHSVRRRCGLSAASRSNRERSNGLEDTQHKPDNKNGLKREPEVKRAKVE